MQYNHDHNTINNPIIVINHIQIIYLGKFDHDRALFSRALEAWLDCGESSPFMAARFRLVKYYNLPRYLVKYYNISINIYNLPRFMDWFVGENLHRKP